MHCPILKDLPPRPPDKNTWPWAGETRPLFSGPSGHRPKISIVTPNYNYGQFIEETIRSVLLQGYPDLEYIIIDGGSTDDSAAIIRKYEKWLSYWAVRPKRGQAAAINEGLARASGDIVAFLNSDDTYYPNCLISVANSFRRAGDNIIFGEGMWVDKNNRHLLKYPTFWPSRYAFECGCTLCQPAVFIPRHIYQKVGNFNESLNSVFDFEYWYRCIEKGVKFHFLKKLLAASRMHAINKTLSSRAAVIDEFTSVRLRHRDAKKMNTRILTLYLSTLARYIHKKERKMFSLLNQEGNIC